MGKTKEETTQSTTVHLQCTHVSAGKDSPWSSGIRWRCAREFNDHETENKRLLRGRWIEIFVFFYYLLFSTIQHSGEIQIDLQCKSLFRGKTTEREREREKKVIQVAWSPSPFSLSLFFSFPCRPFGRRRKKNDEEKKKKTRWVTDKKETRRGIHIER